MHRHVPAPRQPRFGQSRISISGSAPSGSRTSVTGALARVGRRRKPGAQARSPPTVADSPTDAACGASVASRARPSASRSPRLLAGQGVQLVDDDALESRAKISRRIGIGEQQRQRFRRGHQDVAAAARAGAGAWPAACRRSASRRARRGPSRRSASRGCGGCRRPAPSAARCRACAARPRARFAARPGDGRKPASVLPPPVGAISRAERPSCAASSIASWCACGRQPRLSNQRAKRGGEEVGSSRHVCLKCSRPRPSTPTLPRKGGGSYCVPRKSLFSRLPGRANS